MTACLQVRNYTVIEPGGEGHRVFLKVDHQMFCIADCDTLDQAEWFRDQLLIALERMVNQVKGGG